jgi:hypothetical protein
MSTGVNLPIHFAAERGDLAEVARLLSIGEFVDSRNTVSLQRLLTDLWYCTVEWLESSPLRLY